MKKTAPCLFSVVILLALTLTSCYWRPDFNSGGLQVDLSGIAPRVGNDGDVIRVYLFADGLLFSAGGGSPFVAEIPAASYSQEQKVNISGLPVGPKYRAMVGVGPVNSGLFEPYYYGDSGQFLINPNADTSVAVTMQYLSYPYSTPSFSPDLLGKNLKDLLADSGGVFTVEDRMIYRTYFNSFDSTWSSPPNTYDFITDPDTLGVAGYRINGLSPGYLHNSSYLDSDQGILPFYEDTVWGFETSFTTALSGSRDIVQSGSFPIGSDYAVYFRRAGGLGGAYVASIDSSLPASWKWVNVDHSGMQDLVVSGYNAYYAAEGAAFALPPAFLVDGNLAGRRIDLSSPAPVLSLGFRPSGGSPGGTLFLGTSNGVYQTFMTESTTSPYASQPPSILQVAETAGDSIELVAINNSSGYHEAYLSRYYLYLVKSGFVYRIPFFAVFPGRATGAGWDGGWTLYISGTEGLAAIYAGS